MKKTLFTAALLVAVPVAAQVDVVESAPVGVPSVNSAPPVSAPVRSAQPYRQPGAPATGGSTQAELFYQVQVLQQEVLELRGMVEEQAFELQRLKKQRLDDYLDLDRRLSALTANGAGAVDSGGGASTLPTQPPMGGEGGQGDEKDIYRNAIDLVLKQKNYDQAIAEFNRYLASYPNGRYAANAHYWLGEIFLLKNDLEQARQWFTKLLDGYAGHSKAADAKFKLGKVYHLQGNQEKARQLLQEVAGSGTDAARLARGYLQDNF